MKKRNYKYFFFDLDRTLWDFEKNMYETLEYLHAAYLLNKTEATSHEFINEFNAVHENLWKQYRDGNLKKKAIERFAVLPYP